MDKDIQHNRESADKAKKADLDWEQHHETGKHYSEEAKGVGEVDVKNAHAAGDGSFGRNDGLPEKDKDGDGEPNY